MTTIFSARSRNAALAFALGLGAAFALAGPASADPKVLAKVDGAPITEDDVADAMADIGPGLPQKLEGAARQKYVLDYLIDLKLAAKKAEADKLDLDPGLRTPLAYYHDKLAMEELLSSVAKAATTDEAERKAYDEAAKAQPPEQEIHARHILLPTEDEAKAALARVKAGEDFAKVATELSKDPAGDGGDLGWFTKDRMVPEFADAAFKLEPGQISDPVKTPVRLAHHQGRRHRTKTFPPFEQVKDQAARYVAPEGAERRDRRAAQRGQDRALRRRRQAAAARGPAADPGKDAPAAVPARRATSPRRPDARRAWPFPTSGARARSRSSLSETVHGRSRPALAARAEDLSRPAADRRRALRDRSPRACATPGAPTSCWRCSTGRRRSRACSPARNAPRRRSTGAAPI